MIFDQLKKNAQKRQCIMLGKKKKITKMLMFLGCLMSSVHEALKLLSHWGSRSVISKVPLVFGC